MTKLKLTFGAILLALSGVVSATNLALRLTDYALPGTTSAYEILIECFDPVTFGSKYVPLLECYPAGDPVPVHLTAPLSTDKSLQFKVLDLVALTPSAVPYDFYVTFKESGNNPALADDLLRVQFEVLDPIDTGLSHAQLTINLVSGGLVQDYLNDLPATAVEVGHFVNGVNQVFALGFDPFRFSTDLGPVNSGLPLVELFVVPTAVPEPAGFALLGIPALWFFWQSRRQRHIERLATRHLA